MFIWCKTAVCHKKNKSNPSLQQAQTTGFLYRCLYGSLTWVFCYQRDDKAVVAFASDRLNGGRADCRLVCHQIRELPDADNVWITACFVDHGTVAHYVIGDDDAAFSRKLERPAEVVGIVFLVGVDEDEVKRSAIFIGEPRQAVQSVSKPDLDH